jgi:hypothetical protein
LETETVEDSRGHSDIKLWLSELQLSGKAEETWRRDVRNVLKIYRSEVFLGVDSNQRKETFNILWSNTETIRPALYSQPPKPDIRRRFRDKDVLGKHVSEVLERSVGYAVDGDDFSDCMKMAVLDYQLAGRPITRVRYEADIVGEGDEAEVRDQSVGYEQVQWDDFRRGPGKTWSEVPWVAFRHRLTKSDMEEQFPDCVDKVTYSAVQSDEQHTEKPMDKTSDSIFQVTELWEIWDKESRTIKFLAPSYKDEFVSEMDDSLGLSEFFPIPKPMYAVESPSSLIPVTEYSMYETLAKELETTTNRINRIVKAIRVRGIYDSTMSEVRKLLEGGDNEMIPAENVSRLIEQGGIDKFVWMLPIDMMASVASSLFQQRQSLLSQIYEITGISDILRGNSDPNETLGAQRIKANFGSQRLQSKQREVQRYARDLIRMTAEIMAEHFSRETFAKMTGLTFLTDEEKAGIQEQMQAQAYMAQAQGAEPPQPDPQIVKQLQTPSWDEMQTVLQDDLLRSYKIDIETDSTIEADQQQDQAAMAAMMTALSTLAGALGPAVQGGMLPQEAAKQLVISFVRKFKLGREVEDAMEAEVQQQQAQPDPEQMKAQVEQQKAQMEMASKKQEMEQEQQRFQMEMQERSAQGQLDREKAQMDMAEARMSHQAKVEEMNLKRRFAQEQHMYRMEQLRASGGLQ